MIQNIEFNKYSCSSTTENDHVSFIFPTHFKPGQFFPATLQTTLATLLEKRNASSRKTNNNSNSKIKRSKTTAKKKEEKRCKSNEAKYRTAAVEGSAPTEFFSVALPIYILYINRRIYRRICAFLVYILAARMHSVKRSLAREKHGKTWPVFSAFLFFTNPILCSFLASLPFFVPRALFLRAFCREGCKSSNGDGKCFR